MKKSGDKFELKNLYFLLMHIKEAQRHYMLLKTLLSVYSCPRDLSDMVTLSCRMIGQEAMIQDH